MGGSRLFCLDCLNKEGDTFDTLDLCCAPESRCMEARVTYRENIDGAHEPYHRLVKLRTAVLTHHFGRTYKLACAAFERVEEFCARIAGASQPGEEKEKEKDVQGTSAPELTTVEVSKQDDVPATADDTKDRPEAEPTTTTEMLTKSDKSDDIPTGTDGTRDGTEAGPTVTELPLKDDKVDDVPAAADGSKNETDSEAKEKEGKEVSQLEGGGASESPAQAQPQTGDLPTCGNCNGSLSFPFWYCIFCEGQSVPD
jgi:hypothetical protein